MKRVLVTGCDGFIGSHICEELLNNGYQVCGIDNHSKYKYPYKEHHNHSNFKFGKHNLLNKSDWIYEYFDNQIDYVIHCAARIGGIEKFHKEPFDIIRDNSILDANIISAAVKNKVKRFIGLSSSMVYENCDIYPSPENIVDDIKPPSSSYGFSKLSMERMIKAAYHQYDLEYTIIRPFNAVGIRENDFLEGKSSHVVPDLILKCLKNNTEIEILGSGQQIRHYTNVRDIARGIRLALESPNAVCEIFNISTDISTSVLELAQIIWSRINPDKLFNYSSQNPYQYDVQKRIPCTNKAKKLLGFEAEISLDQSIDEVIKYIKDNLK